MNNDITIFPFDLVDILIKKKFVVLKKGFITVELLLLKEIKEPHITKYMYIFSTDNNTIESVIHILEQIKEYIHSRCFLDVAYHDRKLIKSDEVYKFMFDKIKLDYNVSKILQKSQQYFDGKEGICIQDKYVQPYNLRYTSPNHLLYYFKKYINQYILKTETKSEKSFILTINDTFVIGGRFNLMRHILENGNQPILITNLLYTKDDDKITDFINLMDTLISNSKYPLKDIQPNFNVNNNWNKYIEKEYVANQSIRNNFAQLCALHRSN